MGNLVANRRMACQPAAYLQRRICLVLHDVRAAKPSLPLAGHPSEFSLPFKDVHREGAGVAALTRPQGSSDDVTTARINTTYRRSHA